MQLFVILERFLYFCKKKLLITRHIMKLHILKFDILMHNKTAVILTIQCYVMHVMHIKY